MVKNYYWKFDISIDMAVKLGVDPEQANQMVRGVVSLPHGTGKELKVLALVTPIRNRKKLGNYVGLDEFIDKIKGGWTDIDVIITILCCNKIGLVSFRSRGLMQSKSGTVTLDIGKAIPDVKKER